MRRKTKQKIAMFVGGGLLVIAIAIAVIFLTVRQSMITPPTTVQLSNGKFYWISTAVADDLDEGIYFLL
jgi:hypothetical protein